MAHVSDMKDDLLKYVLKVFGVVLKWRRRDIIIRKTGIRFWVVNFFLRKDF